MKVKKIVKSKIAKLLLVITILISLGFQSDFFEIAKQIDIYTTLFKELNMYYIDEVNPAKLTNNAIDNMLKNLDPYTKYYDEQGVEDARISTTGEYGGVGIVSKYKNKKLVVREVLKGFPAEKYGVKTGDIILKIDNTPVSDFDKNTVATLIKGAPKTKVKLQVLRQNKTINLELIREKIEINPIPYFAMITSEIGYISFTQFNNKASKEFKKAFLTLKDQGMKKLIIDVRGNPGGLLNEAVKITNFFIPKDKIVVTTKAKVKKWSNTFKTRKEPLDTEIPITILINKKSASASEILAGSLQDYDRAVVIGERSFGKGLVQRFRELSYGTQMKLTIAKYYTPSGRCIQELDYANRDEKGNVPRFSDAGRKAFKTVNGRIVYGGGGIEPDIKIQDAKVSKITEAFFKSDAFFNYATTYFYTHSSIDKPAKFSLSKAEFEVLNNYVKTHQKEFETATEKEFKNAIKTANEENLEENIQRAYQSLLAEIHSAKLSVLASDKSKILEKLTQEIIKRYYYNEGVYQHKANFDTKIKTAITLLSNPEEYQKVLN